MGGSKGGGGGGAKSGGGAGKSSGGNDSMKAPGGGGSYISRSGFESNPQGYFSGLHSGDKGVNIITKYLGGAIMCDAHHVIDPHPDGLRVSSSPEEVNYVKGMQLQPLLLTWQRLTH